MRKAFLFTIFLLNIGFVYSQNWEEKFNGYVVTLDSMIIKGYLKYDVGVKGKGVKINLYKKPNERPQEFYTLELLGYVFRKDTFEIINNVHPKKVGSPRWKKFEAGKIEAIVLSRGKLVLYKIPEEYVQELISYDKPSTFSPQRFVAYKYFVYAIMDVEGEIIYIESKDFIEKMPPVIEGAPDLVTRIKNKELKFKDMERIVKEYNRRFKE